MRTYVRPISRQKISKLDKDSLKLLLAQGLSVEQIAKRFGRPSSTVAYWMAQHGLAALGRDKHATGGIERERLEELVDAGMTIAEIGAAVGLSKSTVGYWLRRHQLRTRNKVGRRLAREMREAKAAGLAVITFECIHHGATEYVLEGRGYYRCKRCRSESISRHRRRLKERLVSEAGGCCAICGYARTVAALEFHHVDPATKRFGISAGGLTQSLKTLRQEIADCVLLCANCHAEVEHGITTLPLKCDSESGA